MDAYFFGTDPTTNNTIFLKMPDGPTFLVPLDFLSTRDVDFVKSHTNAPDVESITRQIDQKREAERAMRESRQIQQEVEQRKLREMAEARQHLISDQLALVDTWRSRLKKLADGEPTIGTRWVQGSGVPMLQSYEYRAYDPSAGEAAEILRLDAAITDAMKDGHIDQAARLAEEVSNRMKRLLEAGVLK